MSGKTVEDTLKNFGLTEKETQLYIFLSKNGIHRGGEIAKKTRTDKAVVYRILKILQRKGFVESTLESPTRFAAVSFESILDLNIRTKHEEARQIETAKEDLLTDWSKISKGLPESKIEKFVIIEGTSKIFSKIYQMIKQTKNRLYAISTVSGLLRADRFGVFEAIKNHPHASKVQFQFVTDLSNSDLKTLKQLRRRLKVLHDLRGRNPNLGSNLFPRIIIRDQEEILFFIEQKVNLIDQNQDDTCLCTNCKSLIQSFTGVFEDLWNNSTKIEEKINQAVSGKLPPRTTIIQTPEIAKKQYYAALKSAKKEVLIVTSTSGLLELKKQAAQFEAWSQKNVATKIMAPIITENLEITQQLLKWCEVKHVPFGYFETTIIDGKHLFQFKPQSTTGSAKQVKSTVYENTFYTNDPDYIQKTEGLLYDIWRKTHTPSAMGIQSITRSLSGASQKSIATHLFVKRTSMMRNMKYKQIDQISETDILDKIAEEKKFSNCKNRKLFTNARFFGSRAFAVIHPPISFNLSDMIIGVFHHDHYSTFGAENIIMINLWQETKEGFFYVPVAYAQDNPNSLNYRKKILAGFPAEKNIMVFGKDEIKVQLKGNTLFAGWTKPIPLGSTEQVLPPSCLLFEGYGDVKPGIWTNILPSGQRLEFWYNYFDAFVSFFHPLLNYVGSGTEGFFERDSILLSSSS